jgi:hypothetical protein
MDRGLADKVKGLVNRQLEIGDLCFGGHDIYRSKLAFLYQSSIVLELRFCVSHAVALDLQVTQCKGKVPIGPLNARNHLDRPLAKLCIRQIDVPFRDLDRAARLVK